MLRHGTDQLAIACAYCTAAGVELLKPHVDRLRQNDSFLVVSGEKPTNFTALAELNHLVPNRIFVHFGGDTPYETKVGASRMHSKVFYARSGDRCLLWTGSNNLTASATQGVNCEAAIHLEGLHTEQPFQDALAHIRGCRDEAVPFDPSMTALDDLDLTETPTLIIHAEGETNLIQWSGLMRIPGTDYDNVLGFQSKVHLYLYEIGALHFGWEGATPHSAFKGTMTGVNLTRAHPQFSGKKAEWDGADLMIDVDPGTNVPRLCSPSTPEPGRVTTQALINLTSSDEKGQVWLTSRPKFKQEPRIVESRPLHTDDDMNSFFAPRSFKNGSLVYARIGGLDPKWTVRDEFVRERDLPTLYERFRMEVARNPRTPALGREFESRLPCIYLAKYRI